MIQEIGEYMRTTEQKSVAITTAYLSITGIAASIIAQQDSANLFFRPTQQAFAVYAMFHLFGLLALFILRWYRAWKVHYILVLRAARQHMNVPSACIPVWMREHVDLRPHGRLNRFLGDLGNRDELFTFAIAALTVVLAVLMSIEAFFLFHVWLATVVAVLAVSLELASLGYSYVRLRPKHLIHA